MLHIISKGYAALQAVVWGPVMLAFFLFVGALFTVRTRAFQFTHAGQWLRVTLLSIFRNRSTRRTEDAHAISQFQSLCTALAATIGTGSVVGVTTAITTGGPGAVFWLWVSAALGMMTSYAENTLGIMYRYRDARGFWVGGAMVYIERGLGWKWLAVLFSAFCALASFGIGDMTQANSIAASLSAYFNVPPLVTGVVTMTLAGVVILGGIKRVASVTDKFVPFMAAFYILGGLVVIAANADALPAALTSIMREAFNFKAAGGGVLGYGISVAMKSGISRGVFSNEAGLGSSVAVHASSDVKDPATQGMWGIFEVFTTAVVCTLTALVILTSGVYDAATYAVTRGAGLETGAALAGRAFGTAIPFGGHFVALAIVLFAFSTILGWSFYGERSVAYLFGERCTIYYKLAFIAMILVGCVTSLETVWSVADTLNALMAVPNLIALTALAGKVTTIDNLRGD
ncbi:MAG: sodium:alanine symporter family protein [Oscillospiraceae bacterium]|jgi:AGCS family alanine or glycine:cation symporter|nr:sodium:alanine symporter family protein [Oscillospiraceae bacterium]